MCESVPRSSPWSSSLMLHSPSTAQKSPQRKHQIFMQHYPWSYSPCREKHHVDSFSGCIMSPGSSWKAQLSSEVKKQASTAQVLAALIDAATERWDFLQCCAPAADRLLLNWRLLYGAETARSECCFLPDWSLWPRAPHSASHFVWVFTGMLGG